jgi:hypothetical protein
MASAKVVKFYLNLFPAGSIAYHPRYNYCSIVQTKGKKRVISYQDTHAETLSFKTKEVPVFELEGATA